MSATDELRCLLNERGVVWEDATPVPSMKPWKTSFTSFTGEEVSLGCYDEPKWIMGMMVFHTPEQAIAATLGAGTCHKLPSSGDTVCIVRMHGLEMEFGYWRCSECGCECFEGAQYCMNCGRKVVDG